MTSLLPAMTAAIAIALGTIAGEPPRTETTPSKTPADDRMTARVPAIPLFNGESLDGWRGDPRFWMVEDGCIVGRSTPEVPCKITTYLQHDAILDDFELEFEIKLEGEGANSGMQYRSTPRPAPDNDFDLSGYQADFDEAHRYSGILYETYGRGIAVGRGQAIRFNEDGSKREIEPARPDADLKKVLLAADADPKADGWHTYRVVADGRRLEHWIDGQRVMLAEDHDPRFAREGILALQVHQGPPMTVRVRNPRIRDLSPQTPIRIAPATK
ncbi:MAG: DUF1080 domain-containing protein [Phycisphaera sp.]|nr:DUF1080 domain-containing protein [Phycisphaera sp.]